MKDLNKILIVLIFLLITFLPVLTGGFIWLDLFARIFIFALFAASFDLLIGYTGLVSFAHALFFGIGAYATAFSFHSSQHVFLSSVLNLGWIFLLSFPFLILAWFLLKRLRHMFFTMTSLALAETVLIGVKEWESFTGGHDGMAVQLPLWIVPGSSGLYLVIVSLALGIVFALKGFLLSPRGLSLIAIKENPERTAAIGYPVVLNRFIAFYLGSFVASIAGSLYALWIGFISPDAVLGIPLMMDVLMMVIIGGAGTLYGGFIGAFVLVSAQTVLPYVANRIHESGAGIPELIIQILQNWRIIVGVVFVLIVFVSTAKKTPVQSRESE